MKHMTGLKRSSYASIDKIDRQLTLDTGLYSDPAPKLHGLVDQNVFYSTDYQANLDNVMDF